MKKFLPFLMVLFLVGPVAAQQSPSVGTTGGSYFELSLGFGWPWDLGLSFRSKMMYGHMIDQALSFHGGIDYTYARHSESLTNISTSGLSATALQSDVQAHLVKALAGLRITWPWIMWEPFHFFTDLNVGYSLLWSFYAQINDHNLYFYQGDFLSFQIIPGALLPLGERSQATISLSLDIANVSRNTPLGVYVVKEKINLTGLSLCVGISFLW